MTMIGSDNYELANNAMRDILFMYRDLTTHGGFSEGTDTGSFDPFAFVSVEVDGNWISDDDVALLQTGSLVALLCMMNDIWENCDPTDARSSESFKRIRKLLSAQSLESFPEVRKALEDGLEDQALFEARLPALYDRYVAGYFRTLA